MMVKTPLRKWLKSHKLSISRFAREMEVSRPRAAFWVHGATCPRGVLLDTLIAYTGLTIRDLVPDEAIQHKRRLRERRRRAKAERVPIVGKRNARGRTTHRR